jgi:BirA family biotin operon repressor/biotin-[acetyl-CoA-carboxylase] ligase
MSFEILFQSAVRKLSEPGLIGARLKHFASIGSTMDAAKEAVFAVDKSRIHDWHGAVFVADEQTAGRGRRGRGWTSRTGNLFFTFVWTHERGSNVFNTASMLNFATPLAVVEELRHAGIAEATTKWPNDCLVRDKKICGMLVDNEHDVTFVGVGVNLVQDFGGDAAVESIATSVEGELSAQTDKPAAVHREDLLARIVSRVSSSMRTGSLSSILERYERVHALRDATVRVHHRTREEHDDADFDARVLGVSPIGMLRVQRVDTDAIVELSGEEITIRRRA